MRKLKLEMQVSLDGFTADSHGDVSWMVWPWSADWAWDERLRAHHNELTLSSDCILISGRMAEEGFCDHWERVAADRGNPQAVFARAVSSTRKLVATRTIEASRWNRTELIRGELTAQVARLKAEAGRDILMYGGPTLASALIDARLVDEVHLHVNPTALGRGRSMFNQLGGRARFVPRKATCHACGVLVVEYAVVHE